MDWFKKNSLGEFFSIEAVSASEESEFTLRGLSEVKDKFIFANVQSRPI